MTKQLRAGIIYQGASQIDGLPIVAIATYSDRNTKTGKVLQTYIIRSDISPLEASKSGQDFSICANCVFRGIANSDPKRKQAKNRKCYVNLGQGPTIVYKSFKWGTFWRNVLNTMIKTFLLIKFFIRRSSSCTSCLIINI